MELDNKQAQEILQNSQLVQLAALVLAQANASKEVSQLADIDLSTARTRSQAIKISLPFRTVVVSEASDGATDINMLLDSDDLGSVEIPLKKGDVYTFPTPRRSAWIYWDAQSSKTMTLTFLLSGEFKSGSNITEVSSARDGNSITNITPVSVTTTATLLAAQDTSRNILNGYNDGPSTIYVGASGVTAANGIPVASGQPFQYKNTAAVYAITSAGTASVRLQSES